MARFERLIPSPGDRPNNLGSNLCPHCGAKATTVRETRTRHDGAIRRRRACGACGGRWTTLEQVVVVNRVCLAAPHAIEMMVRLGRPEREVMR